MVLASAFRAAFRAFRATLRGSRRGEKPLRTFADAPLLPAADLNAYLMKRSLILCTSDTRPASPIEGMAIYETDTDRVLRWREEGAWA